MKRKYFIATLLFSSMMFGQTNFTNTQSDKLWSTAANWTAGLPSETNDPTILPDVTLDFTTSIVQLSSSAIFTLSGVGKLTFTGDGSNSSIGILSTGDFTYNGAAELNNVGGRKNLNLII